MKNLFLFLAILFFISTENSHAFVYSFGDEKLVKVEEMPNTPEWENENGTHLDVYVLYKKLWILWIPIWNWDAQYVLSSGGDMYWEFASESDKAAVIEKNGDPGSAIGFWDKIGGKLISILLLGVWAYTKIGGRVISSSQPEENQMQPINTPPPSNP